MDNHLKKAQQIISIIWSVLIIMAIIGTVYSVWKSNKQSDTKYRLKSTIKKAKKHDRYKEKDEDTTLIEYPQYKFNESIVKYSPTTKPIVEDLYTYDDLLKHVNNTNFLNEYIKSLRTALESKKKIYTDLMKKSKYQYEVESAKESDNNNSLVLNILRVEYVELPLIINSIKQRLKNLTVETMNKDFRKMLFHKKFGLETIIGRREIKDFIAQEIFAFYRDPKPSYTTIKNFAILGPSGIGKNKLGESMSYAFCKSGILARNKFTIMTSHDLVSQFVSATSHLVHSRLVSHLEGMILIDEAYQLTTMNHFGTADHGKEAITALVAAITKYTGLFRVGALGYVIPMEKQFFGANEGMDRRFPHKIILEEYATDELTKILIRLIAEISDIFLSDKEGQSLYSMINSALQIDKNIFPKQAGDMQNLASTICKTISTFKNKEWKSGDSKNNTELLLYGFNKYLQEHNKPILEL